MRHVNVKQKLEEMGVYLDSIVMGAFYRSNYERGILIYYLIRQHNLTSMLEIGFGRGFSTFCAARAFHDAGIAGKVVTIEPNLDEKFLGMLQHVFPKDWFKYVQFMKGTSQQALPQLNESFDLVYIDGDHSYEGTRFDWEHTKDRWNNFLLFDDYHLPRKDDPGIKCSQLIDEIDDPSKELIIMDRRMFFDDRQFTDSQIDYGQVLLSKKGTARDDW